MTEPGAAAAEFGVLFRSAFLAFHRRDGPRSTLTGASRAVLTHVSVTGPLTIGESAVHLRRAQSVVSEIVSGLVAKGLLAREPDPSDRRRVLVWLTPEGMAELSRDGDVLGTAPLTAALASMTDEQREGLLTGFRALLAAAPVTTHDVTSSPAPHRADTTTTPDRITSTDRITSPETTTSPEPGGDPRDQSLDPQQPDHRHPDPRPPGRRHLV